MKEKKKVRVECKSLKSLETSFNPRGKIKISAALEKLYKTGKRIGKDGDLCGFNIRTN